MIKFNKCELFTISLIKLKLLTCYLFYLLLSIIIYKIYVVPIYGYMGGFMWDLDLYKLIISIASITVIVLLLPSNLSRPTDLLLHIQFILPIFFMLVLFPTNNFSTYYISYVLFSFLLLMVLVKVKIPYLKVPKINPKLVNCFLYILLVILLTILIKNNINYFNLDLNEVYKYRTLLREVANVGIWGYIFKPFFTIIIGFILANSLMNRHKLNLAIISIIYILIFGLTSHKFFLFLPFAMIGFYWIINRKEPIFYLLMSMILLSITCLILNAAFSNIWATSLIIHRVLFLPAQLNYLYFDFFSNAQYVFWTDSKWLLFSRFIEYPYDMSISHLIGSVYFDHSNGISNANTGWLGSGYAHAGFVGMIIYVIILGLILNFLNYRAKDLGTNFVLLSFFPLIIVVFFSGDLKTAFLTNGLTWYLILLYLYGQRVKSVTASSNVPSEHAKRHLKEE